MKYFMIGIFILIISCNGNKNDIALSGVYVASYEHEFGKTDDTLILTKANDGNDIYQINRHSGVIKKLDGKVFPKEILRETWTLEYHPDRQTLTDLTKGKTLVWDSNRLTLQLGDRQYKKISDQ